MNAQGAFNPFMRAWSVALILGVNTFVFIMWNWADPNFMAANFLVSWTHLAEGRYWVLLGSAFSHNMFFHFLLNMLVLNSFGPIVESRLGSLRFLRFYLTAAVISSLAHASVSHWIMDNSDLPALGASGAVSGVILLFAFMYPKERILLFGIIPIPALVGALLFIGLDVWGLIAQAEGGGLPIGHGAHLGGALTGIAYYLLNRPKLFGR